MWAEFDHLRRKWGLRREGAGGLASIEGFQFQLAAALLQLARKTGAPDQSNVFVEALSDIVSTEGGYLVVTQAKLSLHSGAMQKALKELWEIDVLASEEALSIAPQLRYCVLTSRKILRDVESALARWRPGGEVAESALDAFRRRVSVRVEADPLHALAIHLVNAFGAGDPFATVEKWIGRLLANPTPEGLDASCRSIIVELDALATAARELAHRFYIWQATDRPPAEARLELDRRKATLTGQLPTRIHLMEGRFAPRAFYKTLHGDVETWFANRQATTDARTPRLVDLRPVGRRKERRLASSPRQYPQRGRSAHRHLAGRPGRPPRGGRPVGASVFRQAPGRHICLGRPLHGRTLTARRRRNRELAA